MRQHDELVPVVPSRLKEMDGRIAVPQYSRENLVPGIVHIGVGGFHRAHLATYADELCERGRMEWAILGAGIMESDGAMAEVMGAQEGLYTLVIKGEKEPTVQVVGSIVGYLLAADEVEPLVERIALPTTRIVSLTVTEGGYPVDEETRRFDPTRAPAGPGSAFGVIVSALRRRRDIGMGPLTVMSCDNVIGNGDVARLAVLGVARAEDPELAEWIEENVTFPNGMVDRITPATTDADRKWLMEEYGLLDGWPVVTEPFRQWVIEDRFAAGRPPWEELGVTVTDDVEPYELMKLRLLNAGHSCIAYLAALAGMEYVDQAMADSRIRRFLGAFLEREAGPVLPEIPGIDVPAYQASLVERFSNPAIGDQIARLCLDGSAKFPKFLLPTVRGQLEIGGPVGLSALALAGWCSYLVGVTDDGDAIEHAGDPDLDRARCYARKSLDDPAAFLAYERVFGPDLGAYPSLVEEFTASLTSLRQRGVLSTLDRCLDGL